MSLAEELLADLEAIDESQYHEEEEAAGVEEVKDIDDIDMDDDDDVSAKDSKSVRNIAKLWDSKELQNILESIEKYKNAEARTQVIGPLEQDPEYLLIVRANNITVEIDNEINIIHKFVRDNYQIRFPELESLIPTPMEYMRTVRELKNTIGKSKNNEVLPQFLQPAVIMIVSVTASTTQGKEMEADELDRVTEACDMAVNLSECKDNIFSYVESRMTFFAPNVSAIVGAPTAAKLMGVAGGLTKLSQMPACNVLIVGSQKRTLSGFSTTAIQPHTGFIYHSTFIQELPPDIRRKAARLLASKVTLGARVDAFHDSPEGSIGRKLREDIEAKIDKWLEPPPVKQVKALPAPIDAPSKRRGGRRARKLKERLGITDVRRAANRINFAEIEEDAYQEGISTGTLRKNVTGKVRAAVVDSKTKARISKTLQQKLTKANQSYGGSTTVKRHVAGTASSVAFTPLQGLEIVNPQAAEARITEANQKYFGASGGFASVKRKTT